MKTKFLFLIVAVSFFSIAVFADRDDYRGKFPERAFENIDTNEDYYLSSEEYLSFAKKILTEFDTDKNGEITYNEARFKKNWLGKIKKRKHRTAFLIPGIPVQETDKPVKVSEVEQTAKSWFQETDTNKDSRVSEPEFLKKMEETFPDKMFHRGRKIMREEDSD